MDDLHLAIVNRDLKALNREIKKKRTTDRPLLIAEYMLDEDNNEIIIILANGIIKYRDVPIEVLLRIYRAFGKRKKLYGDIIGQIVKYLPKNKVKEIVGHKVEHSEQALVNYPFDIRGKDFCESLTGKNIETLMKNSNINKKDLLWCSLWSGNERQSRVLLDRFKNKLGTTSLNRVFRQAASAGILGIVEDLLKNHKVYPNNWDNYSVIRASMNGHTSIVKTLLEWTPKIPVEGKGPIEYRVDPTDQHGEAIKEASKRGHVEVVKALLKWSAPISKRSKKIKRVDPSIYRNTSIKWAYKNGHFPVVRVLIKDKRVREKLSKEEIVKYESV